MLQNNELFNKERSGAMNWEMRTMLDGNEYRKNADRLHKFECSHSETYRILADALFTHAEIGDGCADALARSAINDIAGRKRSRRGKLDENNSAGDRILLDARRLLSALDAAEAVAVIAEGIRRSDKLIGLCAHVLNAVAQRSRKVLDDEPPFSRSHDARFARDMIEKCAELRTLIRDYCREQAKKELAAA